MLATTIRGETLEPTAACTQELPLAVECIMGARTADALFVVAPDGRLAHWDPQAEALTGYLAEEVVGRPCHEVLRAEREGGGRVWDGGCPVMALARVGHAVPSHDVRVETRLGGKRWVNVSVLRVDAHEGPYLVHLMRDAQREHETLQMARDLVRLSSAGDGAASRREAAPELTPRQAEVLALLSAGRSAREIGRDLFLSQATVRNHIRALLLALGAHSQLEALAKAREAGLLAR